MPSHNTGRSRCVRGLPADSTKRAAALPSREPQGPGAPTDTMVSVPSGWKLQETEVDAPVVLGDLNLHVSFPCVPLATKISFGVYTSKADMPVVTAERGTGKA